MTPQSLLSHWESNLLPFNPSLECRYNQHPGHPHHQSSLPLQFYFVLIVLQNSYNVGRFFPQMFDSFCLLTASPAALTIECEEQSSCFSVPFLFLPIFVASLSNHNLIFHRMRASYTESMPCIYYSTTTKNILAMHKTCFLKQGAFFGLSVHGCTMRKG